MKECQRADVKLQWLGVQLITYVHNIQLTYNMFELYTSIKWYCLTKR